MAVSAKSRIGSSELPQAFRQRPNAQRRRSLFGLFALALLFAAPSTTAWRPVAAAAAVKSSSPVGSVETPNRPPVITVPSDRSFEQGETIQSIAIQATDPDNDELTVAVSGLPSGLSYASGQVGGAVADDATAQDYTVTITAKDGVNAAVTETFTITVTEKAPPPSNAPPVITGPGDKTYEQGEAITAFAITVTDADQDTLAVTLSGLPSGLSYASDQVSGTVSDDATAQAYTVTITAKDGVNAAVTETFTITVTEKAASNAPPVITDPGDKTYEQGEAITAFAVTVTDADQDTLAVTLSGLPSGLSYASDQVSGTVSDDATAQAYTVTITAKDGVNAAVTETFTITVTEKAPPPSNAPPVITGPGDKTYEQGEAITAFAVTVTDADQDTLAVTLTGLPSGLSYASGQVGGTVAADAEAQAYTVTITADDGVNAAVTETFTITVTVANRPPVITVPSDRSFEQGETVQSIVIQATDPDSDELTVAVAGLPSGLSYGSGEVGGTVAADAEAQAYTITITADDGVNAAVTETFTITVTVANRPPVITAPSDRSFEQGETIQSIAILATDPDSDELTVSVSGLPSGLSYASGQVGGTVAADAAAQTYTVTITADDGVNAAVTETFTITVTATGTIPGDGGAAASITLSLNPSSVGEGDGSTSVTVTATADTAVESATEVTVSVGGSGTAASGWDYLAASSLAVTIPANATAGSGTFTLTPNDDGKEEGDETIGVSGSASGATVTGATLTLTDGVNDNDGATAAINLPPAIAVPGDRSFEQGETIQSIAIQATDPDNDELTVAVSGLPSGLSYASGQVGGTVAADAAAQDYTVTITADDGVNTAVTETFTITVTATDTATGTLPGDGGAAASITLSVNPSSVGEGSGSTSVTVTATADTAVAANTPVTVSIGGGTATAGTDYLAVPDSTITIPANATAGRGTFTLTPNDDGKEEGDETISVSGSAGVGTVTGATLTLTDGETSDGAEAATYFGVKLFLHPGSISEDGGTQKIVVQGKTSFWGIPLKNPRVVTVTVGKRGDSAVSGTDYAAVPKFVVKVPVGRSSGNTTINLRPIGDFEWEGNETITFHGTGVSDGVYSATMTITDEDDRPYAGPQINLSVNPSTVSEADGPTSVTVTATSSAHSTSRTVRLGPQGLLPHPNGGVAVATLDYQKVSYFDITLPANATSATGTFTLTPIQDTLDEGNETIPIAGQIIDELQRVVHGGNKGVTGTSMTMTDDDEVPISLSAQPASVSEDGGAKTVTVTATAKTAYGYTRRVTVAAGKTNDTATPGTDFAIVPFFDVSIPANATTGTGTFILTPTNDNLVEPTETITIHGVQSIDGKISQTGATSMSLTDDEQLPAVTLSANPSSVGEGASATTVTVTATAASAISWRKRTVLVGIDSTGTATYPADYTLSGFGLFLPITIEKNQTTGTATFTLTPKQDTAIEGDETIVLIGQSARSTVTGTTITLADDDTYPAVTLSANPSSVSEGASATTVTVTATATSAISSARTVTVSVGSTGTATSGTDYTAVSDFTITIAANATTGTGAFTLTPTQDTAVEGGETIGVSGASTGANVTGTTITLTDDDSYPAVTLSANPSSVSEGASATTVTVTATAQSAVAAKRTVTVSVGQTGTASSGADYKAVKDFNIIIAANATSGTGTFTLTPIQDTTVEGSETVGVDGSSTNTKTVTGTTVTLTDDDSYPAVTLSASPSSVGEDASATTVTVTATAKTAVSSARTVTISVGGTGTATSGTDYAAVTDFTISLAANATTGTGTFTLTPTDDTVVEGDETIGVAGTSAHSTVTGTTLTLADDDRHPVVTLSVAPSSVREDASATTVTVTATPEAAVASARTVTVSIGSSGDSATSGTDYAAVADFTITIAANATSGTGTFTLTPTDDTTVEGIETISVSGSGTSMTVTGTAVTLEDDDLPAFAVSATPSSISENGGAQSITVTVTISPLNFDVAATVTVGRSGDTAIFGTDYTAAYRQLLYTFSAGETSATLTFTLTPTQDTVVEGDETISFHGQLTVGNSLLPAKASIALTDDDTWPVTLSAAPSSVGEGASATSVTVTATAASAISSARTVTVAVGGSGTATSGTDYKAVSDFDITIAANATTGTGTFSLTPIQDTVVEGSETIGLSGTGTSLSVTGTTVTLTDDDSYPAVTLSAAPSSVSEGASGTTVTVTATAASAIASARTVTVSVGGTGTATSGTDYAAVSDFDIAIGANATTGTGTFTLTPTQDTAIEGSETIGLSGASPSTTVTGATLTLTDDDGHPEVTLSATPASVSEGASATAVTVTATAASAISSARAVTVSVGGSGTATSGTDYAAVTDFTISIAANATSGTGTFTLTPTDDTALEGDETIGIAGTSTNSVVVGTTLTLTDDDYPAVTLSAAPSSVGEQAPGTTVTVTATAASAISSARAVTVSVGGSGTATSGADYAAVSDFTITIGANATTGTGTFTLTPVQDAALEGDETIGVAGTSPHTTVTGTVLTLADDDRPTIALATVPANVKVAENVAQSSVTVRATAAAPMKAKTKVTLTVGASGDSATKTADYTVSNVGTITIPKGQASAEAWFDVAPVQDTLVEGDETVSVSGSSDGGNTVTGTSFVLTDNDVYPDLTLSAAPASVAEGASATAVTVTATAGSAVSAARTVTVSVGASGTATSGTDYATVSDFTITLAANSKTGTGTFTLTPTQDTTVEGSETIGVAGTSTHTTVTGTTVTLTDDDSYPALTLSTNPSSVSEGASATTVTVTATATTGVSAARTVTVSVGGSGTASPGVDYATVADFTLTIAANAKSGTGTFTLTPTQDTAVEGDETIGVAGTSASSTVTGTTVTLADDDTHAITLSASPSTVAEDKSSETITVTATINIARTEATTVTVSVGDSADTAQSGTDYTAVPDFTITIAANATKGTGTFEFKPLTDTAYESFESVTISGRTSPVTAESLFAGGASGADTANVLTGIPVTDTSLTIHDASDYPPVTLTATPSSVGEGASATQVTVTATATSAIASSREVTVSVGGSGTATSGTDYAAVSDFIIKIAANATSATGAFTLTPTQDTLVEGNETIGVSATSLSTSVTGTTVTLTDDDAAPSVSLSLAPSSIGEGDSGTQVTVTAEFSNTNTYADDQTVTVSVGDTGTATSGTDYAAVSDFDLTIAKGQTRGTATFTLTPTQDTLVEGAETIGVSGSATGLTVNGADLTLTDDDTAPAVNLSLNPSSAGEGDGATQVTVTAVFSNSSTYAADQTVTVSVGGSGTATSGTDYAAVSDFDLTIAKGQTSGTATFTLTPTGDTLIEGDETIGVAGAATGLTVNGVTLTLTDDDATPAVNLSLNPSSVGEGDGATQVTVTAVFSNSSTYAADQTVTVAVGGSGTATSGTDYAAVSNFDVTITKGTTSGTGTFTLTPTDDTLVEGNETVGVAGSATGLTVNGAELTLTDDDAAPAVNLSLNPSSVGENASGTSVTVTAAFSNSSTYAADQTVTVAVGGSGTATSGTDYAAVADFDVTITKGTTSGTGTFTLTPTDDTLVEGNETIGLAGSTTGLTVNGAELTLTDDDGAPAVNLSLSPSSVGENASGTSVTVTAAFSNSSTYAADQTVTVAVGGSGTATSGRDYAAVTNFDVTISKGKTSGTATFTLTPTQDTLVEGNETIGLAGSTTGLTVNGAELTLTDDDSAPSVNLSSNPSSVGEGDGATQVTVTAAFSNSSTYAADQTVTVSVGGSGTATSGTDYAAVTNFDVTISKGKTSGTATFTLTPTQDTLIEGNETIGVAGTATGLTVNGAELTLTDDDGAPAVNLTLNPSSVGEGASGTSVTVTAAFSNSSTYAADQTVTVSVGGSGTATSGTDYAAVTDFDVTISKGQTSGTATFTLTPTQDTLVEGNETIGVAGTVTGLTVNGADLTLADDDAVPAVTIADASANEGDSITFTVRLDKAVEDGLTVTPGFRDGTATEGVDYTANTAALAFAGAAGETRTFTVGTTEDTAVEEDETFTVSLSVSGTSASVTTDTATGTITDDDSGSAAVTIADASAAEGESITFTVRLDKAVEDGLTVTPGFADGTATEGVDYTANTAALAFAGAAGETRTFTVATTEDTAVEADETFTVSLSVSGTSVSVTTDTATGTITDDDGAKVAIEDASAAEGEAITFTVRLDEAVEGGLTVTPGFTDGTATEGADYTANTAALAFAGAAGETRTFTVATTEDTAVEADETFTVSLSVSGTSASVTTDTATGTITDDDGAKVTTDDDGAKVAIEDASAAEGDSITFTVRLDKAVSGGLTVTPGFTDGTAIEGKDYTANTAALAFAGTAGETRTFTVATTEDTAVEADETFTVSLSVSGTSASVTTDTATGTITDDDSAKVAIEDASAAEGDSITFTVRLDKAVPGGLTVTPGFTDGTAIEGKDYTANTAALAFAGAAAETWTFAVATTEDTAVEADKTFTVSLSVSGTSASVTATDTATGTISDDDGAKVTITDASALEGEPLIFTVTLDKEFEGGLTVTPNFSDGTATEGVDYTADPTPVRFTGTVGEQRTITVQTTQDNMLEADEMFNVSLQLSSASAVTNEQAMGMIRDDDVPETRATTTRRVLSLLARSVASESVDAIGERFLSQDPGNPQMNLGSLHGAGMGRRHGRLDRLHEQPFADLEWLNGGRFALPTGAEAESGWANWTLWGRAAATRSALQTPTGSTARGDLFTTHLGFETRPGESLLLGAAVSHSMGDLGYTVEAPLVDGRAPGEGDGGLTSVQPYLHWAPQQGLTLWGMGGFGSGSLTVTDTFGTVDTPLGMGMFAGGGRKELTAGGNMAIKADAFHARLRSQEQPGLMKATGTATRVRLLLEGSAERTISPAERLTSRVQAGSRWDDGNDLSGLGAEIGGGLAYVHTRLKLGLEAQGRYLLAHQAKGFEEWGASVTLRVGPGVDGPGPWFALEPQLGAAASRAQELWGLQAGSRMHASSHGAPGATPGQVAMTAGYRLNEASDLSVEATREQHAPGASGTAIRILGRLEW